MKPKWAILLFLTAICLSCASGPAPERNPKHLREGIYYHNKGAELFTKGCYRRAMAYFQDTHQIYVAADEQAGVARALNSIADTYFRMGDMESALLVYGDAIALSESEKMDVELVRALSNKAAALLALHRSEDAAVALDRAGKIVNKRWQEALYLKTRALLLMEEKNPQQAKTLLESALDAPGGGKDGIASSIYFSMGRLLLQSDQPERARTLFEQALTLDSKKACHHDIARDLEAIATTHAAVGEHADAVRYYKRSVKIYALLKDERRTKTVVSKMRRSAAQANIDIQMTLKWVQTWLTDKSVSAICD